MPRMSKKLKEEWSLFLNERGRMNYNDLCRKCRNNCKQIYRAVLIDCPNYYSKRAINATEQKGERIGAVDKPHKKSARNRFELIIIEYIG